MRTRVGFDKIAGSNFEHCHEVAIARRMRTREKVRPGTGREAGLGQGPSIPAASTKWKRVTRMGVPFAFVKSAESMNQRSGFDKAPEGAEERRRAATAAPKG
jgi:hypothetical protein